MSIARRILTAVAKGLADRYPRTMFAALWSVFSSQAVAVLRQRVSLACVGKPGWRATSVPGSGVGWPAVISYVGGTGHKAPHAVQRTSRAGEPSGTSSER